MRTIKYRQPLFDRFGKFQEWHYWGFGIEQGGGIADVFPLNFKLGFCDPKDSLQFTGLKDKNRKDIYEGDIVRKTMWYLGTNSKKDVISIGQVKWNDKSASFLFYVGHYLGLFADNIELEVIGNIYENSELLK